MRIIRKMIYIRDILLFLVKEIIITEILQKYLTRAKRNYWINIFLNYPV